MGEFFLALGVLLLAAFVFVVWLIARVVTWIVGGLFGIARQSPPQSASGADAPRGGMKCRRPGCHEANPLHARFCRRCGNQLAGVGDVTRLRYVA